MTNPLEKRKGRFNDSLQPKCFCLSDFYGGDGHGRKERSRCNEITRERLFLRTEWKSSWSGCCEEEFNLYIVLENNRGEFR